jgi:deoxycytidine triphosphate deaminase
MSETKEDILKPGVLTKQEIRDHKLIVGLFESNLKDASYDLTLGADYLSSDNGGIVKTLAEHEKLELQPNGVVLVSSREIVQTDGFVCGRFDLKIKHALHGLVLQVGTQVEPNYNGPLFGLILNLSSETVKVFQGEDLFTIEFHALTSEVSGAVKQIANLAEFLQKEGVRDPVQSALSRIERNIETRAEEKIQKYIKDYHGAWEAKKQTNFSIIAAVAILLISVVYGAFIPTYISKMAYSGDARLIEQMKMMQFSRVVDDSPEGRKAWDAISKNPKGFHRFLELLESNPDLLNSPDKVPNEVNRPSNAPGILPKAVPEKEK